MRIPKTTQSQLCNAAALTFCFSLIPGLVCAEDNDKNKRSKPAPTNQAPPPAAARPAQSATQPTRPVQQEPVQQQNTRPVQQPPVQQQNDRPVQQPPVPRQPRPIDNVGGPNTPMPDRRGGITGTNPQQPNTPMPDPRGGITSTNPQQPTTGRQQPRPAPLYNPPPNVTTTSFPGGGKSHFDPGTRTTVRTDTVGHVAAIERPGVRATGFRDGRAAHIEQVRSDRSTIVVNRGFRGERRVEVVRPGGVRVVVAGGPPFVERPFRTNYVSRAYVIGNRTEVRVYRGYTYNSIHYVTYVPAVYYRPEFYGWVGRPWGPRVAYAWGWEPAAPWYYGGYFAPAPVYDSPSLWLADYVLAANLRASYDNQQRPYQDQQYQPQPDMVQSTGVMLTPEIKMQIAEEVKAQIEAEKRIAAERAIGAPPPNPNPQETVDDVPPPALQQRLFIVSASLDVTGIGGGLACALTAGDVIERTLGQPVTSDGKVAVNVMSSKDGDCPADFATLLDIATLQEMQNQFKVQIAAGMEKLSNEEGKSGVPDGPIAGPRKNADGQAVANAEDRGLVAKIGQEADQTEADINQASNGQ